MKFQDLEGLWIVDLRRNFMNNYKGMKKRGEKRKGGYLSYPIILAWITSESILYIMICLVQRIYSLCPDLPWLLSIYHYLWWYITVVAEEW